MANSRSAKRARTGDYKQSTSISAEHGLFAQNMSQAEQAKGELQQLVLDFYDELQDSVYEDKASIFGKEFSSLHIFFNKMEKDKIKEFAQRISSINFKYYRLGKSQNYNEGNLNKLIFSGEWNEERQKVVKTFINDFLEVFRKYGQTIDDSLKSALPTDLIDIVRDYASVPRRKL